MITPVTVSIDVPHEIDVIFEFLDVMANHEPFNDHLMTDWELSGPERGVGGTRITFEFRWIVAPLLDRLTKPMTRAYIRRNNTTSMRRLAGQLDSVVV